MWQTTLEVALNNPIAAIQLSVFVLLLSFPECGTNDLLLMNRIWQRDGIPIP